MTPKRILLVATFALAIGLISFSLLSFNKHPPAIREVQEAWMLGDLRRADALLGQVEQRLNVAQARLLRSYLLRDEGLLEQSNDELILALGATTPKGPELQWEIHLNLGLNALISGEHGRAQQAWAAAQSLEPDHPLTSLLAAAIAYERGDYGRTATILRTAPETREPAWLAHAMLRRYSSSWRALALARCAIEEGNYTEARRTVERAGLAHKEAGAALIALSYLRAAEDQPLGTALADYRQALRFLDRVSETAAAPHPLITEQIWRHSEELHTPQTDRATRVEAAACFATLLYRWGGAAELTRFCSHLLQREPAGETIAAIAAIADPQVGRQLGHEAEVLLQQALSNGEGINEAWSLAERLSDEPKALRQRIADDLQNHILDGLVTDDQQLTQTRALVASWSRLARERRSRYHFAQELADQAPLLWRCADGLDKGYQVALLAAGLPSPQDQSPFLERLTLMLRETYKQASQENDVDLLSCLCQIARHFHIEQLGKNRPNEIANQIADANHLLEAGRVAEAHKRAAWVLQLDATNRHAHRILGLILYGQDELASSLVHLRYAGEREAEVVEKRAICELLVGDPDCGEALLQTLYRRGDPLTDQSMLLLAYRALEADDLTEAQKWLDLSGQAADEAYAFETRYLPAAPPLPIRHDEPVGQVPDPQPATPEPDDCLAAIGGDLFPSGHLILR